MHAPDMERIRGVTDFDVGNGNLPSAAVTKLEAVELPAMPQRGFDSRP